MRPTAISEAYRRSTPLLEKEWKVVIPKHPRTRGLPRHILILRHGQSMGNVDESLFTTTPDWKIPLSDIGRAQARQVAHRIQAIAQDSPIILYVSPYARTKETLEEVMSVLNNPILFKREEPRLREQDFGNFQDADRIQEAKLERPQFGRFFYRFPNGESGADVFDRVSAFCGTFRQDMDHIAASQPDPEKAILTIENSTALFVTHGITARLFLMRWLHWSVDEFEQLHNPPNCGLMHLKRDGPTYRLTKESTALIKAPGEPDGALKLGVSFEGRKKSTSDLSDFEALVQTARGT